MLIEEGVTQQQVRSLALQVREVEASLQAEGALALQVREVEASLQAEEASAQLQEEGAEGALQEEENPALRHPTCAAPCPRSPKAWF